MPKRRPSNTKPRCVVVIADVIASRERSPAERRRLQQRLQEQIALLNDNHHDALLSKFAITLGDEFQAVLKTPASIPQIFRDSFFWLNEVRLRWGVGCGTLATDVEEYAIGMDGPAFHQARQALEHAKDENRLGGVFTGFGPPDDDIFNGFARLIWDRYAGLKPKQLETVMLMHALPTQSAIAAQRGVTESAVSDALKSAGWDALQEAERGWEAALGRFDFASQW